MNTIEGFKVVVRFYMPDSDKLRRNTTVHVNTTAAKAIESAIGNLGKTTIFTVSLSPFYVRDHASDGFLKIAV